MSSCRATNANPFRAHYKGHDWAIVRVELGDKYGAAHLERVVHHPARLLDPNAPLGFCGLPMSAVVEDTTIVSEAVPLFLDEDSPFSEVRTETRTPPRG